MPAVRARCTRFAAVYRLGGDVGVAVEGGLGALRDGSVQSSAQGDGGVCRGLSQGEDLCAVRLRCESPRPSETLSSSDPKGPMTMASASPGPVRIGSTFSRGLGATAPHPPLAPVSSGGG